ncbi:MAG: ABC transporter permease [Vicinamibacterales bacterium]
MADLFRAAWRQIWRAPGFSLTAVAMLAIGIGVNGAVFTVARAALFDGYPLVQQNDRIVRITTSKGFVYYPDFERWREGARSFADMALVRGVFHAVDAGGDAPETAFAGEVTANTFRLLGVSPMLGRDFTPSDAQPGATPVVILRHDTWVRSFGATPAAIGRVVRLDDVPTTVIGVMPRGFSFPATEEMWTPLVPSSAALARDTGYARHAYGRLADGATVEGARAELDTIGRRLAIAFPRTNGDLRPVVSGFSEWFIGRDARALYQGLWAAVGFVLLVVCANVANLMLAQAMGRSREIAIRLALGAARGRIVWQCLVESLTLSLLAGLCGWGIARALVSLYASGPLGASGLNLAMDERVIAYLIATSMVAGLLTGAAAAARLAWPGADGHLIHAVRDRAGSTSRTRLVDFFVRVEVVLAVALLASTGVVVRSVLAVYTADLGVETKGVLTMSLYLPPDRYPMPEDRIAFYRDLVARAEALPGVRSVGLATAAPTDFTPRVPYELEGESPSGDQGHREVGRSVVSNAYFRALGATLMAGREFDDSDRATSVPVAIVNQAFVKRHWPDEAPIGRRLRLVSAGGDPATWLTVVGVVGNIVQNDRTRQAFEPLVYVPYAQSPQPNMFAFVRSASPPEQMAAVVRREIDALDPALPVPALGSLDARLERAFAFEGDVTAMFAGFAGVALLLASVGLYTAVAQSVTGRTRELGVRMALGATARDILALVCKQGFAAVGVGLVVGLALSLAVTRLLGSQVVGVSPADPIALLGASTLLVAASAFACWLPARRAARVDPAVALRSE